MLIIPSGFGAPFHLGLATSQVGAAAGSMPYNVGVALRTEGEDCQMSSVTCLEENFPSKSLGGLFHQVTALVVVVC